MDPRLDEALGLARTGDPRAFRQVAEHLGPKLIRYLTVFLRGDVHAAHDVVQDTFVQAWDALDGIGDAQHLRRWCYRVARCKAISWLRRRVPPGRRVESLDRAMEGRVDAITPWRPPDPASEGDDLVGALQRAIRRLPVRYAGPVELHYVQGYTTREAARLLGLTRTTVKMRLHRARAFLRREIHREAREWSRAPDPTRRPPR